MAITTTPRVELFAQRRQQRDKPCTRICSAALSNKATKAGVGLSSARTRFSASRLHIGQRLHLHRLQISATDGEDNGVPETPWEMQERVKEEGESDVPYGLYLLACAIILIAMVGTIFEFSYQNALFGVVQPDSIFYKPICGFFVFTGFPTTFYLWTKATKAANDEADRQDRMDGF